MKNVGNARNEGGFAGPGTPNDQQRLRRLLKDLVGYICDYIDAGAFETSTETLRIVAVDSTLAGLQQIIWREWLEII